MWWVAVVLSVPVHTGGSPFTLLIQSAVTCLQWPAEYIIVFGLAEGKVTEERETRVRY